MEKNLKKRIGGVTVICPPLLILEALAKGYIYYLSSIPLFITLAFTPASP